MPAPIIRGDYDKLQAIAKTFARNAQELQKTTKRLQRNINSLESGGWIGKGANKFYQEMSDDVMPSMNRLTRSMTSASRVTIKILKLFQEAESIWKRIFRALGLGGVIGVGAGAGAGAGGGGGGGGVMASLAGAAEWQGKSKFLVRNPSELFKDKYWDDNLINSHFDGEGTDALGDVMNELLDNPSEARTDELLDELADIRGRPRIEIQIEWEKFKEVQKEAQENNPEEPPPGLMGGSMNSHMGSNTQMRYGKVVGDAFGIDPAFGAMLNPTGGLAGPGNLSMDFDSKAVGYHGVVHDAAGYLYNYHKESGPGYDYLKTGGRDLPGSPYSGQTNGIPYWRNKVGTDSSSERAEYFMGGVVGVADAYNAIFD